MEEREFYVAPTLDELGTVRDVTGDGFLDIGGILDRLFGGGPRPPFGSR